MSCVHMRTKEVHGRQDGWSADDARKAACVQRPPACSMRGDAGLAGHRRPPGGHGNEAKEMRSTAGHLRQHACSDAEVPEM